MRDASSHDAEERATAPYHARGCAQRLDHARADPYAGRFPSRRSPGEDAPLACATIVEHLFEHVKGEVLERVSHGMSQSLLPQPWPALAHMMRFPHLGGISSR
jgi:hypothetical protein